MDEFMGIPYTKPIYWLLNTHSTISPSLAHVRSGPALNEPALSFPFLIDVETVDTIVDVYQTHAKCCWPRTLIESRVTEAHERLTKTPELDVDAPSSVAVMTQHFATFLKAVYSSQNKKPSRSKPTAQRIVFKNQLPTVLRCNGSSNGVLYTITGALKLVYKEQGPPSKQNAISLSDPKGFADHKREILQMFPMMMAIAPNSSCAAYVQSERASTTLSDSHSPKPQILILKELRLKHDADNDKLKGSGELKKGDQIQEMVWEGVYSPFTWILNPLGNERSPFRRRSQPQKEVLSNTETKYSPTSACAAPFSTMALDAPSSVPAHPLPTADSKTSLEPLSIGFDIFATHFHDVRDKKHALKILMDLLNASDSRLQKKICRFSVGLGSGPLDGTVATPSEPGTALIDSVLQSTTVYYTQRLPSFIHFLDFHSKNSDAGRDDCDELSLSSCSRSNSPTDAIEPFSRKRSRPLSHQSFSSSDVSKNEEYKEVELKNRGGGFECKVGRESNPLPKRNDFVDFPTALDENFVTTPRGLSSCRTQSRANLVCVGFLAASKALPRERCQDPNAMLLYNVLPHGVVYPLCITSIHGKQNILRPLDNVLCLANALMGQK